MAKVYPVSKEQRLAIMQLVASMCPKEALLKVKELLKDSLPEYADMLDLETLRAMNKCFRWDAQRMREVLPPITVRKQRGDWSNVPPRKRRKFRRRIISGECRENFEFTKPTVNSEMPSTAKLGGQFSSLGELLDPAYEFAFGDDSVLIAMPWEKFGMLLPHLKKPFSAPSLNSKMGAR